MFDNRNSTAALAALGVGFLIAFTQMAKEEKHEAPSLSALQNQMIQKSDPAHTNQQPIYRIN